MPRKLAIGIAGDVLAGGTAHQLLAIGSEGLDAHLSGLVQQDAIGDDLGFQASGAKLLRHVIGGLAIPRSRRQMRLGGERLQVLASQPGVRDGEEFLLNRGFGGEAAVAKDSGRGQRRVLRRQRSGNERQKKQIGKWLA